MAVKCTNWREVELEFARAKEEYDRKAVEWLSALGERVVKYAREHGSYTDHTGNLRNSIGYVVVQYGRIIAESFKVGSINSIFYFLHKAAEPFNCLEQDNLA